MAKHRISQFADESGNRYGKWTVLRPALPSERLKIGGTHWICRCDCGAETVKQRGQLRHGSSRSCGCAKIGLRRLVAEGERFGEWTIVLSSIPSDRLRCLCRCSCGLLRRLVRHAVITGKTDSCGHTVRSRRGEYAERHGLHGSPEYKTWSQILARCHNPRHRAYKYYGAKGLLVYEEWRQSFAAFFKYVGLKPTPSHTLDRIDNTKGYEPNNVRWATHAEQVFNRGTVNISTIEMWAIKNNVDWRLFSTNISNGSSFREAMTTALPKSTKE